MDDVYASIHDILGHRIDDLRKAFKLVNVKFPNRSIIKDDIHNIRHNVIHRSGKKVSVDHLENLPFSKEGLCVLIEHFNTFVATLMDEVNRIR